MRTFVLSILFSFSVSQADPASEISSMLRDYFSLLENKEVSKALDHVHPALLNMIGKETFEKQYEAFFGTPGMEVNFSGLSVDSISPVFESEEDEYALVNYTFQMTFKVDLSEDHEEKLTSTLLSTYQSQYGKENVSSEVPGTYVIKASRELFAVHSADFEGWKILDYEKGMEMILKAIIPEAVFQHFNK